MAEPPRPTPPVRTASPLEFTVDHTPISDALALHAMASAFEAQRSKPPVAGDPHRSPDVVAVARKFSELGKRIADLGDEVLFRPHRPGPSTPHRPGDQELRRCHHAHR
ncbi:hypothetical protein ACFRCI_44480 [Streptomyces sp. NPDC056638]|uniref:hypothetical protein n=1 Tax=Streptomyces sp. NPDC056638 TaxID=3345887 RepID=UPI00368C508E